jgi:hypothetical protein
MADTRATEERQRLEADVNRLLQDALAAYNSIDRDLMRDRLEDIRDALGDEVAFDELLYAGSVAKHTAVDGLSDVDALMTFAPDSVGTQTPQQIRERSLAILRDGLDGRSVDNVTVGRLAITVHYRDGMEIQLLPAVRSGDLVNVPNTAGTGWIQTRPADFRNQLSAANEQLGGRLVPGIKLFKAALDGLPVQQQKITGYHAEALAVHAARTFPADGPRTFKAVLVHIVDAASKRVMDPMRDVTGQSSSIDPDLGASRSTERRLLSDALQSLHRRMTSARNVGEWKTILGADE